MIRRKKGKKKASKAGTKDRHMLPPIVLDNLLLTYQNACKAARTTPSPKIMEDIRKHIVSNQYLVKFFLFPNEDNIHYLLEPLIKSIRNIHYTFIKDLYLWRTPLEYSHVATLALMLEKGHYKLTTLELEDCSITSHCIDRLARSFQNSCLVSLVLDFNEFGDEGAQHLCRGLVMNTTLLRLSLNYCAITYKSGKLLGKIVASTAIREVYLDSNHLGLEGVKNFIQPFVEQSIIEAVQKRQEKEKKEAETAKLASEAEAQRRRQMIDNKPNSTSQDSHQANNSKSTGISSPYLRKTGKKKKKKVIVPLPPKAGAWISKLHLADNGLDLSLYHDTSGPLRIMMMLKNYIANSMYLIEMDLDGNLIGDLGGLEIRDGLLMRKTASLPQMKLLIGARMQTETLTNILKLSGRLSKKKKIKKKRN